MKIKTLSAALLVAAAAQAQTVKPLVLKAPNEYYIQKISPNGKWACGVFLDYSNDTYSFRWNLESDEIELLSPSVTSYASSVSNDGVVAGWFTDDTYRSNGATLQAPGYYANGKWTRLEFPADEDAIQYGTAYDITPDGHYISGTLQNDAEIYTGYIWKDGKIYRELTNTTVSMPYAISPDGQVAGGWIQKDNRAACIWNADNSVNILTPQEYDQSPWSYCRQFSSDGKKVLYFGGWADTTNDKGYDGLKVVYNIDTKDVKVVYPATNGHFEVYGMSDDANTILGINNDNAYIWTGDSAGFFADYLIKKGVDLSQEHIFVSPDIPDVYQIEMGIGISADGKVMGARYYNDDKDDEGEFSISHQSMVVKFDQPTTALAPANVKADQVNGLNSVLLSWVDNVSAQGITGYNVYRDGAKLNSAAITDKHYVDANVSYGTHNYTVSAIYGSTESEKSNVVAVSVAGKGISTPKGLYAAQRGYNSAYFEWTAPSSNFANLTYFDASTSTLEGFGNSEQNSQYEVAVSFDAKTLSAYGNQKKIQAVGFYPMSEQKDWKINFYTHAADGSLQNLYSQPVNQTLKYGERNLVKLTTPLALPAGELIVAVQTTVATPAQNINGMGTSNVVAGSTDLVREVGTNGDADFYSLGDMFQSSTGYLFPACWAIDAIVSEDGLNLNKDVVDHYNITSDGKQVASAKTTSCVVNNLSAGSHKLGIYAVYADGSMSATETTDVTIAIDTKQLAAVDTALIAYDSPKDIVAAWDAPKDRDVTTLQYCADTPNTQSGVQAPEENNYSMTAGVLYSAKMFRGRDGYRIKSVRFYPQADAVFTVQIFKDSEIIDEIDVDDYTLNKWNTVNVDKDIFIDSKSSYRIAIDCYDASPNTAPLGIDQTNSVQGYSDTYSLDGGETWNSISSSAIYYNWLIGMEVESPEGVASLPAVGYDVNIDGKKVNDAMVTDRLFRYSFAAEDTKEHTITIDTYYAANATSVKGGVTRFNIGATGINGNVIEQINIAQGDNEIAVSGNATSVELISASGAIVASAKGNSVSLNGVTAGVYVVKAVVDGETIIRKIQLK